MGWLDSLFGGGSSSTTETRNVDPKLKELTDKLLGKATGALDMAYPQYTGQRTAGPSQFYGNMQQSNSALGQKLMGGAAPSPFEQNLLRLVNQPGVSGTQNPIQRSQPPLSFNMPQAVPQMGPPQVPQPNVPPPAVPPAVPPATTPPVGTPPTTPTAPTSPQPVVQPMPPRAMHNNFSGLWPRTNWRGNNR